MPQRSPAGSSLATLSEVPGTELRQLQATFENFREFVARYSPWLSDSCIFVETLEAVPVGAPVRLEIWLRDRPLLVRALGQVDWVRTDPEVGEEGPPGVALNITYLDPASARLIDSIFRLYTGQQSAAMGKDVVETWELDVESLIDQAFPGAPEPRAEAAGKPPAEVAPAEVAPADTAPAEVAPADSVDVASPDATSPDAAPTEAESSDPDSLDWTLPDGVVVAGPAAASASARSEPPPQDAAAPDPDSLDWTLPDGVVVADPGALSDAVPASDTSTETTDRDSLDWTLPDGVVVADPGSPPQAPGELEVPAAPEAPAELEEFPEVAELPAELEVPIELGELPDAAGIADELEVPIELEELPDATGIADELEIPIELGELPDAAGIVDELEVPIEPDELEMPEESAVPEAPAVPLEPAMPVAEPATAVEPPACAVEPPACAVEPPACAVEPPAWAGSDAAALSAAALSGAVTSSAVTSGAAGSAAADLASEGSDQAVEPMAPSEPAVTDEDTEWEARFSSAFSEHQPAEPAETMPQAQPEAAATEVSGFGFGLVEEPALTAAEAAEEALPPLSDDTATYPSATTPEIVSDPGRTMPISVQEEPTPAAPVSPAQYRAPVAPATGYHAPAAPAELDEGAGQAAGNAGQAAGNAGQAAGNAGQAAGNAGQAAGNAGQAAGSAQPLAGAASASEASDASFLRRSVLVFLLAVVAVGVLFLWFRGRQTTPSGGETIAEIPAGSTPASEPVTPPAGTAAPHEVPEAAPSGAATPPSGTAPSGTAPPAATPSGEQSPGEPSPGEQSPGEQSPGEPSPGEQSPSPVPPAAAPSTSLPEQPPPAEAGTEPAASAEAPPAAAPAAAAQDPAAIVAAVEQRIKTWAAAWSRQQPAAYIECYAPDFSPPGLARRTWEQQRAARIRAPASILAQAKDISVEVLDASRARATFYQDYETDTKHLYTWKTMELSRLPEGWKIVKERVGR